MLVAKLGAWYLGTHFISLPKTQARPRKQRAQPQDRWNPHFLYSIPPSFPLSPLCVIVPPSHYNHLPNSNVTLPSKRQKLLIFCWTNVVISLSCFTNKVTWPYVCGLHCMWTQTNVLRGESSASFSEPVYTTSGKTCVNVERQQTALTPITHNNENRIPLLLQEQSAEFYVLYLLRSRCYLWMQPQVRSCIALPHRARTLFTGLWTQTHSCGPERTIMTRWQERCSGEQGCPWQKDAC